MTEPGSRPSVPPMPDRITWSGDCVVVRDEHVLGSGQETQCERFLGRVFRVEGVRSIALDRSQATASIRHQGGPRDLGAFLMRLSAALREEAPTGSLPAFPRGMRETTCTLFCHRGAVSTCEVVTDQPGRLRLRHDDLRRDHALARQVEDLFNKVPGVRRATFSTWTESLLVRYDATILATSPILRLVEEAVDRLGGWDHALEAPTKTRFWLPNANLGIAALADFAIPALMPVSTVLLVGINIRTFRAAWLQVRQRKFGLPVLYTIIVVATLASGQFLASALMTWFFKFWQGRLRSEMASERRRLLDACLPLPRLCRLVAAGGGEVLAPVARLRRGDRIEVRSDEPVPADGRVIAGGGIVDERSVRGLGGASRKRPGDTVLAGSTVLAGWFRIEVAGPLEETRAKKIGRSLVTASSPAAGPLTPTLRAEAFADRTVGPTLATAGLGLLVGDLTAAGAILRPDYATGPALAFPLETLRDAALCARSGIVVRTHDAFERLARVDLIVLDDDLDLGRRELEVAHIETRLPEPDLLRYAASAYRHLDDDRAVALRAACLKRRVHLLDLPPAGFDPGVTVVHGRRRIRVREYPNASDGLHPLVVEIDGKAAGLIEFARSKQPAAGAALARIRDLGPVTIALVSERSEADVAARAALLGVDLHVSRSTPQGTALLLRACRERGMKTAFVGRCTRRVAAAVEAYVAVSIGDETDLDSDPAAVLLLQPRLDPFAHLWEIARSHEDRLRALQRFIMVPNLLCVAGAFFFGATALTAVMVSNLGTFGLYSSAVRALQTVGPAGRGQNRLRR